MKRLYLVMRQIPFDMQTEEEKANIQKGWPYHYFVSKVVGDTVPKVRTHLSEAEVQAYCADAKWTVEIT